MTSNDQQKAEAVLRGLAGIMLCPACGVEMTPCRYYDRPSWHLEPEVTRHLLDGWECRTVRCFVYLMAADGVTVVD